jgi:hypothetical protein
VAMEVAVEVVEEVEVEEVEVEEVEEEEVVVEGGGEGGGRRYTVS